MPAYRRVYDSRHLQADCQEPGSAPEPYARQGVVLEHSPSSAFKLLEPLQSPLAVNNTDSDFCPSVRLSDCLLVCFCATACAAASVYVASSLSVLQFLRGFDLQRVC